MVMFKLKVDAIVMSPDCIPLNAIEGAVQFSKSIVNISEAEPHSF